MRAIVIRESGPADTALRLENVPDPVPGAGQVVVQVAACGVCFHDVAVRNGTLRAGIAMPLIPGHEVAGTVVALGGGRAVGPDRRPRGVRAAHPCLRRLPILPERAGAAVCRGAVHGG